MPLSAPAELAAAEQRKAVLAGIGCYAIWGLMPLFMQAMAAQGAHTWEIMAHRIVWGLVTCGGFVVLVRQGPQVVAAIRNPKVLGWLALSACLIACNWSIFVWAVNHGRTLEASLGYYITPLINMAAGALMFRERIGRIGMAAIALTAIGVAVQGVALGHLPYIALVLAASFGAYGIVRKKVAAEAVAGLFVECLVLILPALLYVAWLEGHGHGHFLAAPAATFWLVAAGPITAVPLALFSWAARRMPLSSLGFLQFIGPSMSFFIGVAEGEVFTPLRALSFAFIWLGAAVFVYGVWRKARGLRVRAPGPVVAEESA